MANEWDEYAQDWDQNQDVVTYANKAFESLIDTVNPQGLRILDFGCGTGQLTQRISPLAKEIVAIDSSEKMISVLKTKNLHNVSAVCAELTNDLVNTQPEFNKKFDLIVASSVCSFLPDFEATLLILKSLLHPGGTFVQWDWLKTNNDGDFGFTGNEIKQAYVSVGFNNHDIRESFSLNTPDGKMTVLMGIATN